LGNFFRSSGFVVLILAKKMDWATFRAIFFTNSSGHPVADGVARDKKFRS
jgi:hypothetical protein